jgi:PTH1 family peptidyl-tRNA hydrolase
MVVDALALSVNWHFHARGQALVAEGRRSGQDLLLVKPMSYMNLSGRVVADFLKGKDDEFLVVVDDVDLELGTIRLRKGGGTSGHNGLASIIESLGTDEFSRLRMGVGPRPDGAELSDYVLESFPASELQQIPEIVDRAGDAILLMLARGIDIAMNEVNAGSPAG